MRHTILAALSAVLTRPPLLPAFAEQSWGGSVQRMWKGVWLLTHPRTSAALARVFGSSKLRPLLQIEPRLMFKFLGDYLAADLSRSERAALLLHHYAFLDARAEGDFFQRLAEHRLELWQHVVGEHVHRIVLLLPRTPHGEGDLSLLFETDGDDIYNLSFTIGPGTIAGLPARDAMYIARVQGKGKGLDQIRDATKSCQDVSPAALLLAAAEGIAEALDVEIMIGIGASVQAATSYVGQPENFAKAYDEFWTAMGGSRLARNMYRLEGPSPGKSILSVKRGHRSRTHRKRRFKRTVKELVCRTFRADALRDSDRVTARSA